MTVFAVSFGAAIAKRLKRADDGYQTKTKNGMRVWVTEASRRGRSQKCPWSGCLRIISSSLGPNEFATLPFVPSTTHRHPHYNPPHNASPPPLSFFIVFVFFFFSFLHFVISALTYVLPHDQQPQSQRSMIDEARQYELSLFSFESSGWLVRPPCP